MTDAHTQLGAHLYRLWVAGRNALPSVASVHAQASLDLWNISGNENLAFVGGENFGGGGHGPVQGPWTTLLDDLRKLEHTTSVDIEGVAKAVLLAVTAFSEEDGAAKAEFEKERHDKGDPPVITPPASV
jgi:hypothetical protein